MFWSSYLHQLPSIHFVGPTHDDQKDSNARAREHKPHNKYTIFNENLARKHSSIKENKWLL